MKSHSTLRGMTYTSKELLSALRKISRTLSRVTRAQGLGHALKVTFGPTLDDYGIWRMTSSDRELVFWERQVIGVGSYAAETAHAQLDPARHDELIPKDVRPYLHLIPQGGAVLDVGAGPVSRLSCGSRAGKYKLTATDLLTEAYRKMLAAHGFEHVLDGVRYVPCSAEKLSETFPAGSFDFISINNALDHTTSPREVFHQLVEITKPGGHIVITGHSREGSNERWQGMHQHDIWLSDGRLMRCGRFGKDEECLNANLPVEFVKGVEPARPDGDMAAVFRKYGSRAL
jgi:SAM-dependent methyltransferase